jgi:hypothetical protein
MVSDLVGRVVKVSANLKHSNVYAYYYEVGSIFESELIVDGDIGLVLKMEYSHHGGHTDFFPLVFLSRLSRLYAVHKSNITVVKM